MRQALFVPLAHAPAQQARPVAWIRPLCAVALAALLAACSSSDPQLTFNAEIKRTSFGIPHVTAGDYQGLGYGIGYAFAQDNFCVLAEKVAQVNGEHALHFGAGGRAVLAVNSQPNIGSVDSDFFYRLVYDKAAIETLWRASTVETQHLARGYAAGVNRYLRDTGAGNLPEACRGGSWVRPITEVDLYLWWSSIATIAGAQSFAQFIVDAQPPAPGSEDPQVSRAPAPAMPARTMLAAMSRSMAQVDPALGGAGSNGWAFGRDTTANGQGMLLTNPHWPWTGMTKFYQAHLTIPGVIDVMGVTYPGVPFVLVGFNETMGWTHTVATGARFVIRQMKLGPTPTTYEIDGVVKPMTAKTITVEVKGTAPVTRTYYTTEFGPMLRAAPLGIDWTTTRAFAFTDPNLQNNRVAEQWLAVGTSRTAEEARQRMGTILGNPLINTIITDSTGDAVYIDYTTKPYLSDAKLASCAPAGVGQALTAAGRPVMDGSRSACNPDTDPSTRQAGLLPASQLPFLRRTDYVVNANNSYWLTNPAQPITGLPAINGAGAADIGLRPRMNFIQVADRLAGRDGLPGNKVSAAAIQAMLIGSPNTPLAGNRSAAAELLMPAVLALCDEALLVTMPDNTTQDIAGACAVLRAWDRRYNAESVGTHVFREFFNGASAIGATLWAVPFSAENPVFTPRDPNLANATVKLRLQQSLGGAVRTLAARGIALNRPWGELFYTAARGKNLPAGGGSTPEGVTNQMVGAPLSATGYNNVLQGSSYVATMAFGPNGPEVDAVLIPGQSTDPASPYYFDQMEQLWTQRKWHRLPFRDQQIAADPNLTTLRIAE